MQGADTMPPALICAKNLSYSYDSQSVFSIEEWALEQGDNQLLIGASGSGKTTFLSLLTGLLYPTTGSVEVRGNPVSELSSRAFDLIRARMFGIVFQDHHLISGFTVKDNLRLVRAVAKQPDDDPWISYLLESLGIADLQDRKPMELSRGEAQRVALARAAAARAPIILADEPTSALDDQNTAKVMALLLRLCEETDATLLVATHDQRITSYFDKRLTLDQNMERAA